MRLERKCYHIRKKKKLVKIQPQKATNYTVWVALKHCFIPLNIKVNLLIMLWQLIEVGKSILIHSILLIFIMWCNKKLHYDFFFFSMLCYCGIVTLVVIISFSIFIIWNLVHPYLFNFWAFIIFFSFCCIICVNY